LNKGRKNIDITGIGYNILLDCWFTFVITNVNNEVTILINFYIKHKISIIYILYEVII